jgi:hypothetical protein
MCARYMSDYNNNQRVRMAADIWSFVCIVLAVSSLPKGPMQYVLDLVNIIFCESSQRILCFFSYFYNDRRPDGQILEQFKYLVTRCFFWGITAIIFLRIYSATLICLLLLHKILRGEAKKKYQLN